MLRLDGQSLQLLKGDGGAKFARFVDSLIRGEGHVGGLPQSEIDTQVRVNIRDGGIDTSVRAAVPNDRSGFLGEQTCWQYKAQMAAELDERVLTTELNKREAKRLVGEGFAYRFCLLGDLPPEKVAKWESHLLAECRKIRPDPAVPRVVAADKLCEWVKRFPAAVAAAFPHLAHGFLTLEVWQRNEEAVTPKYVGYCGWESARQQILNHVTAGDVLDPCLAVRGVAGVGKNRLVFQCLSKLDEAAALVIYTNDEDQALALSQDLAADHTCPHAVVVADECSLDTRMHITQNIKGYRQRLRFICLSNDSDGGTSGAPDICLNEMPPDAVEAILVANFPNVPPERRAAYRDLAGGFIRLSADLCQHHDRLAAAGDLGPVLSTVATYVNYRLPETEERTILDFLSLFKKVGAKAEMRPQLQSLCDITQIPAERFLGICQKLKDSPGFVNIAGRFVYATPEIVARSVFERAWKRWVEDDPGGFVNRLHPDIVDSFMDRLSAVGTEEAKAVMAARFRDWVASRGIGDLIDLMQVRRLCKLAEADPDRYLRMLRDLVLKATPDALRAGSPYGVSPRRELVWLCEKLSAFSECYPDCEAILFRLATFESETNLGNNATEIWCQLQRVFLSGSSVPFRSRFETLRRRIEESDESTVDLCMKAIEGIFANSATRMGAPATIGGRLRPQDWYPATSQEHRDCHLYALALLRRFTDGGDADKKGKAIDLVIRSSHFILNHGLFEEVRLIYEMTRDAPSHLQKTIEHVEEYLRIYDRTAGKKDGGLSDDAGKYLNRIRTWLREFHPKSFSGRLRVMASRSLWNESLQDTKGNLSSSVLELASEAIQHPEMLEPEIGFLMSDIAKASGIFGDALGRVDTRQALLPTIFGALKPDCNTALARGYVYGTLRERPGPTPELMRWILAIDALDSPAALAIRSAGGERLEPFRFAIESVDSGKIPATVLTQFAFARPLSGADILEILRRLVRAQRQGHADASKSAVLFLAGLWQGSERNERTESVGNEEVRQCAWEILEATRGERDHQIAYERDVLLNKLVPFDPSRGISILFDVLLADNFGGAHDYALQTLVSIAPARPAAIMARLGNEMVDQKNRFGLFLSGTSVALLSALPPVSIVEWARANGMDAVRAIARQLPLPRVDPNGTAVVPDLTLALLTEFGQDAETREAFVERSLWGHSWSGNGGEHFRAKAAAARRFLAHENLAVREWAQAEVARCERLAKEMQRQYEERML